MKGDMMIGRVLWFLLVAALLSWFAYSFYKVYKEDKRNKLRESVQKAAATKAMYEELAKKVKTVGKTNPKDKETVNDFIEENK